MCVCVTGHVSLPLTTSFSVSSPPLVISSWTPLAVMMASSSGRVGNEVGFSDLTARRKLAASVAQGKQVEGRREHGLLSTRRKRRELQERERERGIEEGNSRQE